MMFSALLVLALTGVLAAQDPVTRIVCGSCHKPNSDRGTPVIDWTGRHPAVTIAIGNHEAGVVPGETVRFDTQAPGRSAAVNVRLR